MVGFTNGLTIIIAAVCKCPPFKGVQVVQWTRERFTGCTMDERESKGHTLADDPWQLILTLVHVFVRMAIIQFYPKVPQIGKMIPA